MKTQNRKPRIIQMILIALLLFPLTGTSNLSAQCEYKNTAFKGGEYLTYNLYYNWNFVWVKAGSATMSISDATYNGKSAYKASLITRGNSKADKMYVLRDTLLCYTTKGLAPLYFRKGAKEGDRYTVDEVWYTYSGGKPNLTQKYRNKKGVVKTKKYTASECIYDMMNMFLRARSFDPSSWQKGHIVNFQMADGDNVRKAQIKYHGKTKIKADDKVTYNCLELSYVENRKGKWKEVVRFYVTDDARHVPIRLDLKLKFGSAKAFLTSMKGTK